jgi:hypothetical protein
MAIPMPCPLKNFGDSFRGWKMKTETEKIKEAIELMYLSMDEQQKTCGKIVGNIPFDIMYAPEDKKGVLDDTELNDFLKGMRELKGERKKVCALFESHLPDKDTIKQIYFLILQGFDALYADYCYKQTGKKAAEYRNQKQVAEKAKREAPLLGVTYKEDFFLKLIKPLPRGRPKETSTKELVKQLYRILSPAFDMKITSPEDKFKIQNKPNALKIIHDIFYAFYGESKTRDAFRAMVSRP